MGSSTDYVDFSLRQNKAIERSLVFAAVLRIATVLGRPDFVYVGFGSVWFIDFEVAHREVGIETMISIESDPVVYERARFNKPYRTVDVLPGYSHDVIPELLETRPDLASRPWIVWLDYDQVLNETKLDELDALVASLPYSSMLLTTFSASPGRYAQLSERLDRFESLLGDAFPKERFPRPKDLRDEHAVMVALSDAVVAFLQSRFLRSARKGEFVPAFNLQYQDGTPMATAGGVLVTEAKAADVHAEMARAPWLACSSTPIVTPPLTPREVAALRGLLPNVTPPDRTNVKALGFDLLEDQIESFATHYLLYPSFAQTVR